MNARIQSALSHIPADDRDTWVRAAMAIKSEVGDDGFDLWDQWSQTADNYNAAAARSVWRSCRGRGVTIGTLFHEAKGRGWRDDDKHHAATPEQIQARKRELLARQTAEGIERERLAKAAARKAGWILHQTKTEQHAYFGAHGMPDFEGLVWRPTEQDNLLCVPMRIGKELVGVQLIDRHGAKKFLSGQKTSGAEYLIDNKGMDFWVEGYASGLSLRACLSALRMRYRIHVTFSAGNLKAMANSGYVIADNDASGTGERVAIATGLPYWMSDVQGEDINDAHKRLGLFRCSQMLQKWIRDRT